MKIKDLIKELNDKYENHNLENKDILFNLLVILDESKRI